MSNIQEQWNNATQGIVANDNALNDMSSESSDASGGYQWWHADNVETYAGAANSLAGIAALFFDKKPRQQQPPNQNTGQPGTPPRRGGASTTLTLVIVGAIIAFIVLMIKNRRDG